MSLEAAISGRLDMDRTVRNTILVLQRTWRSLIQPALLLVYLPGVVVGALRPHPNPFDPFAAASGAGLAALAGLVALIPYAIYQAGLFKAASADLTGAPLSVDEAIRAGRQRLWALVGLELVIGLGVSLGCLLLIVPGVLLGLAWSVAAPALVLEDRPIADSLKRSLELTRGSRLRIFGLGLAFAVLTLLAAGAVGVLSFPFPSIVRSAVLMPLINTAAITLGGVLQTAVYTDLTGQPAAATP